MSSKSLSTDNKKGRPISTDIYHRNLIKSPIARPISNHGKLRLKQYLQPSLFLKPKITSFPMEKERLYEDNIQLKKTNHVLGEQLTKLKTKLLQLEKEIHRRNSFVEQNSFTLSNIPNPRGINSLRDSLNFLKKENQRYKSDNEELKKSMKLTKLNEIEEERDQYFKECKRLRSIIDTISKENLEKTREIKSKPVTPSNRLDTETIDNQKLKNLELKIDTSRYKKKALKEELLNAKNKIENYEAEKNQLTKTIKEKDAELLKSNQIIEDLKSKLLKTSNPQDGSNYPSPKLSKVAKVPLKVSQNFSIAISSNSFSSPIRKNVIKDFFNKISVQILNHEENFDEFVCKYNPENQNYFTFQEFWDGLQRCELNVTLKETKEVYDILEENKEFSANMFIEKVKSCLEEKLGRPLKKQNNCEELSETFIKEIKDTVVYRDEIRETVSDLKSRFREKNVSKKEFYDFFIRYLPDNPVEIKQLDKLFSDEILKVESILERKKMISYFIGNSSKEQVIEKLLTEFFPISVENLIPNNDEFSIAVSQILSLELQFRQKCEKYDKQKRGYITWFEIRKIISELGLSFSDGIYDELKIKCYSLEQSLLLIPYVPFMDLLKNDLVVSSINNITNHSYEEEVEERKEDVGSVHSTMVSHERATTRGSISTDFQNLLNSSFHENLMQTRETLRDERMSVGDDAYEYN
ncbi:unnamed protein product [Blepharisma stoltei]|uniref:EF-hand domain-containing protein n=1 Tax=Blepharisma stoltei TaxID=1481888 RepID=A0AAU9J0F5_9CILI|nr:unnamed protein product [Blepharisma stoltei]